MILQVFLNFPHIFKDNGIFTPARDALHLGMVTLADEDNAPSLLLGLLRELSDAVDVRAHGAHDLRPARRERGKRLSRLAVGADEDRLPRFCLPGARDKAHPKVFELPHDARVVHDAAEHRAAVRPRRFLREPDRALHAVAEAGGLS